VFDLFKIRKVKPSSAHNQLGEELINACMRGDPVRVSQILGLGADPNDRGDGTGTPLVYASVSGNRDVIAALLQHGADPNVRDKNGDSALGLVTQFGHIEAVSLSRKAGTR
jgi:ankyrin repeat protein